MPNPFSNRPRLQPLEARSLPSTTFNSFGDIVINGTDAHDRITLTRLDEDWVRVTVQSFHDPEWTRPTDDPVLSYEVAAGPIVGFNGGAGHDRVELVDPVFGEVFVRGTLLPDDGDQLRSYVAVPAGPSAPATLTDGVELIDGAEVEMFFNGYVYVRPIEILPVPESDGHILPLWPCPDESPGEVGPELLLGEEIEAEPVSGDGLVLLIGEDGEFWSEASLDPGPAGDAGMDWLSDEPALPDLWAEWADDVPIDWIEGEASYGLDDAGAPVEEEMDEWLETDLESGAG